jgi:hypothetical protein
VWVRWRDRAGVFYLDLGDDERAEIVIADRPPDLPSREERSEPAAPSSSRRDRRLSPRREQIEDQLGAFAEAPRLG